MTLEFQDALLQDINKDLVLTNSNLKVSSSEINHQGEQINNTMNKLGNSFTNVKKTDDTFTVIERKEKIFRLFLYCFILLEFIVMVCLIIRKIVGFFK
jgi:site-specific DNA-adenine methylase